MSESFLLVRGKKCGPDNAHITYAAAVSVSMTEVHRHRWGASWPHACCFITSLVDAQLIRMSLEYDVRIVVGTVSEQAPHAWITTPEGHIIDPTYGQFDFGPPLRVLMPDQLNALNHIEMRTLTLAEEDHCRRSVCVETGQDGWAADSGVLELFRDPVNTILLNR